MKAILKLLSVIKKTVFLSEELFFLIVIQELNKAAATQLQIVGELKIAASIGKLPGKPKPK